jgi:hypothetical protein
LGGEGIGCPDGGDDARDSSLQSLLSFFSFLLSSLLFHVIFAIGCKNCSWMRSRDPFPGTDHDVASLLVLEHFMEHLEFEDAYLKDTILQPSAMLSMTSPNELG